MSLEIRELRRDDHDEVAAWIDVVMRAVQVSRPGHESRGLDAMLVELANPQPGFEEHHLVGVVDGKLVGAGDWWLFSGADGDKALVATYVDPAHQDQGHGRALADAVEARAGRPVLLAEVDFVDDWSAERDGRFAAARGFTCAHTSTVRELPWPADPQLLDTMERPTPGYEVVSWTDGLPAEHVEAFGRLMGLVDKDAPSGEVEWNGEPLSPQSYAAELRRTIASGGHVVETVAFALNPDGTRGDVVGLTTVDVPANSARFMSVGSTYVHRAHRGHGLGLALKVAIERELLALGLPHPALRTGNADENSWMVGINEQLGFVPVVRTAELVKGVVA